MVSVHINGTTHTIEKGTRILDYLLSQDIQHPHICYSEVLGPVQSCDTCMCEVDGNIMRACSMVVEDGMDILTSSELAKKSQEEAMDRILENHLLYCTVCDNNNGDCRVHNTVEMMGVEHQNVDIARKGMKWIRPIHFIATMQTNVFCADVVLKRVKTYK